MNRRTLSRVEKLETVWRQPLPEYQTFKVVIWNRTDQPDPFMSIQWARGRPTKTVYHQRVLRHEENP